VIAVVKAAGIAVGADVNDADVARSPMTPPASHPIAYFLDGAGFREEADQFRQIDLLHALAMNAHGMEFESGYEVGQCHHTV
jgi:hypothetical protein